MPGTWCLVSVILVASQAAFGGQIPREQAPGSAPMQPRTARELPPKDNHQAHDIERQKLENLSRVRGFADHIQGFRNLTARVRGLIGLADILWKEDEPYARKLFTTAYEAVNAGTGAGGADRGEDRDSSAPDFEWLRLEVVTRIARHDAAWAKRLATLEADTSRSGGAYFRMAGSLALDEPKQASQYIEMGLDSGGYQDIASLLDVLRHKDPGTADALFLRSLQGLAAQPYVDTNQLLMAGSYVLVPDQYNPFVTMRGHAIFNFSGISPLASQSAIRAYFDLAVEVFSRPPPSLLNPASTRSFEESKYIAASVLLPIMRQYVPERVSLLEATMRDLGRDVPGDITEEAIHATAGAVTPTSVNTLAEALKELDGIRRDSLHDWFAVFLSHRFFLREDFQAAKAIAGEVRDLATREKLLVLVGFEEAAELVDHGKLNEAMALATKLSPGIERAVLWLAIANKHVERGDAKHAGTTMAWALAEANRLEDPRRAVLILRAAADLAGFDLLLASQTMAEAVRTFNRVSPYSPLRMEWSELATPQLLHARFPLQAGGLDFQLALMLVPLAKMDMEGTIYEVMSLEDEEARGQGLAVLASVILDRKAASEQKGSRQ